MRDRRLALVALVLLAAVVGLVVGLLSCKGDESAAPPTGSTVGTPENRAPFVEVLLPGGAGTRWEEQDADAVDEALSGAGVDHSVDTAEDAGTQVQQAQEALPRATVLLLAPVDGPTGAAIVQGAKGAGVPVVQYDRFPLAEPLPDYFAGYDQEAIGRMQAQGLVGQRRLPASVSEPVGITNDPQLINDTVIRDGAMTWDQICTPAYERFCPPPSQRQGE